METVPKTLGINTVLCCIEKDGETWFWEVSIAQYKAEEAYGSAIERNLNVVLPWRILRKFDLMAEMLEYCEDYMSK